MLERAESEDQDCDDYSFLLKSHSGRNGNRHRQQGGSLQDLVESVNNENLLDSAYSLNGPTRRISQQNSRYRKYSSSVSSRQREGGSLPCNVNVSANSAFLNDSFLNEFSGRTSGKLDRYGTINSCGNSIVAGANATITSSGFGAYKDISHDDYSTNDTKVAHTVINIGDDDADETRHLLAHESLAQVS